MISSESNLEAEFTFESERGGIVDSDPFRILVIGDFSGDAEKRPLGSRRPIEIDRDNFDEVIAKVGVSLTLDLDGQAIALTFSELDDFHPDRIFAQVGLFSDLRDVRRRLKSEDTFHEAAREVRSWFPQTESITAEPAAAEPENGGEEQDLLSQILSAPGGGAAVPKRSGTSQELNSLLSELVRGHLVNLDEDEQSKLIAAVDGATSELMRKILHDHKFQALEASWRGLFFMVRRTETDSNLSIHLLDATKDDLAADLRAADDLAGTFLYKTFVTDTIDTPGADRWSAIVGDYAFRPEVDDIAMLARVAKLCAVIDAPFVSHIRPDVLGVASLYGNEDPRLWKTGTDSDFGKLWAALRSMPESEYLGLAVPRFLARLPYGSDTEPLETFFFEEFDTLPVHDTYLWANPAFVCGLLLAQSFSEHEWEMGNALKQDIEDLPLHLYKQDGETVYTPCSEVLLTESAVNKLIEYGLMPLISFKNTDRVRLGIFQSVTDPPDKLKGRWN